MHEVFETDLVQLINNLFATLEIRDEQKASRLFDEHVVFEVPYAPPEAPLPARGREAVLGMLIHGASAVFETIKLIPIEFYPMRDPQLLVVEYRSEGRVRNTGKTYANRYAGIFRIKDGKVILWREYFNPEIWSRAMT